MSRLPPRPPLFPYTTLFRSPDVVLMDLQLPAMSGAQAIEQLGLLAPTSRVLVLTRSEQNRVVEAIIAGAHGYMLRSEEHTSELQSLRHLVCRLLLEKKKQHT